MDGKVRLSISVADDHLQRMEEVGAALRKAGLRVEQTMPALGVVTGSIDTAKRGALHRIQGVQSVEEERTVGISPPGSSVQ